MHFAAQTGEAGSGLPAVIIGREIAMSALRELAASLGGDAYKAVAVSSWGKWKTATQACPFPHLALVTPRVCVCPPLSAMMCGHTLSCMFCERNVLRPLSVPPFCIVRITALCYWHR